jgi:hypothetical protein
MSVASVLEREGNVRDMREIDFMVEKPIWDRISKENIMENMEFSFQHVPFLTSELYTYPEIKDWVENYNTVAAGESRNASPTTSERIFLTDFYFKNKACARLFEGDLTYTVDNEDVLREGKIRLEDYVKECESGDPVHHEILNFLFDFKVTFPAEDVSFVIEKQLQRFPKLIKKIVSYGYKTSVDEKLIGDLRSLAIIKLLSPEKLEEYDVSSSHLYKEALRRAESALESSLDETRTAIGLVSYLKFFAADKAVLGPSGITLTMPTRLSVDSSPTIPEIRRFDS